ncbi:MAG: TatD family hydrolase [Pseudomonadota bacterium]|nr:TatD family hydrolase [Pseudomonadota bacterium]
MFVDSHCHLNFAGLADRLPEVLAAMAEAQVDRALCICTTLEEFPAVHAIATSHANLWCSVGVHPDNEDVREPGVNDLLELAALPKVVAIGETGLDYFRLGNRSVADMEWQRQRFRVHIRAALQADLPLVIHTRSAADDTLQLVREEGGGRARGVFHCFTESAEFARAALELGFYISFSGILTFKNAEALREVAAFVPTERCLIETDSPYLAPAPFRGKTNMPAYVPWVAKQLAELKGLSVSAIASATSRNFECLFGPQGEVEAT